MTIPISDDLRARSEHDYTRLLAAIQAQCKGKAAPPHLRPWWSIHDPHLLARLELYSTEWLPDRSCRIRLLFDLPVLGERRTMILALPDATVASLQVDRITQRTPRHDKEAMDADYAALRDDLRARVRGGWAALADLVTTASIRQGHWHLARVDMVYRLEILHYLDAAKPYIVLTLTDSDDEEARALAFTWPDGDPIAEEWAIASTVYELQQLDESITYAVRDAFWPQKAPKTPTLPTDDHPSTEE